MGWTRDSGAIISLALLASVVANYAIHHHFDDRHRQTAHAAQIESPKLPELPGFDESDFPSWGEPLPSELPRRADRPGRAQYHSGVRPAVLTNETSETSPSTLPAQEADHQPVPVPGDAAAPTQDEMHAVREILTPGADAVRNVIDDELAESSREEREIWFHELKSLPAGVVRDLLQVRKQLRSLPKLMQRPDPATAPPAHRVAEVPAEPASQSRRVTTPDWGMTLAALEQACAIARHNLANAATPGFKRFRVFLADTYSPRDSDSSEEAAPEQSNRVQVEGVRLSATILDLEQGLLLQTDRPLDLAIDGDGFFVAVVNDRTVYTRCGAMMLDSARRICLAASEAPAILQPVITIPADAREIQISAQGQVSVLRKPGTDPEPVGQLQVARFANAARLRPIGDTLLVPTVASGRAETDLPDAGGRGVIQQGCLEQSNTDAEAEQSTLNQWQSLMKTLPIISHPVTARGHEPASR